MRAGGRGTPGLGAGRGPRFASGTGRSGRPSRIVEEDSWEGKCLLGIKGGKTLEAQRYPVRVVSKGPGCWGVARVNNPRKSVAGKEPQDTSLHFKLRLREKGDCNQVTGKKKVSLVRTGRLILASVLQET